MVGSKDLQPSTVPFFPNVFYGNQFREKPIWPAPGTSLSGKTAIITGGNTGLGYETAVQLLDLKLSHLVLAVRSPKRGEEAATKLRQLHPEANIEVWELDLDFYDSIQAFARRAAAKLPRIDIVILNAGLMRLGFSTVKSTGHQETIQVNYLSTVLLAIVLLPILKTRSPPGQPAHLTIVGAALALNAKFPNKDVNPLLPSFDDPKTFNAQEHYHSSKLLAHMFLWNLVDYVSADDVIVNIADCAFVRGTGLARDVEGAALKVAFKIFSQMGRTPKVGASCFVDAVEQREGVTRLFLDDFAAFLYTPEGKVVTQRLWDETLAELEFAGVHGILDSMRA